MLPHDLTVAVVGGFILWFGWYGFNPGSTLSAMDMVGIGRIAANTTLAASTGGLAAIFFIYFRTKKWDAGAITNGFLAGLVAITCPCYWVSPTGACILGAIAGVIVILGVDLLEYLRIDDPIGAWPVHGLCGVWGTLSLGLFGSGEYNIGGSGGPAALPIYTGPAGQQDQTAFYTGLFYGGGWHPFMAQCIGSFVICAATFIVAFDHLQDPRRDEPPPHLEGRRNRRYGYPRARHLGLPRICHLGPRGAGRYARGYRQLLDEALAHHGNRQIKWPIRFPGSGDAAGDSFRRLSL